MDTPDSTTLKRCPRCGRELPATRDHFHAKRSHKDGFNTFCKECNCAKSREWHAANKEKAAATGKAWHEANRERISEYKRQWKRENRERLAERAKAWYADNRESTRVRRKAWYDANADHARAYTLKWAKDNPDKTRTNTQRYRARKVGAGGTHTADDLAAIRAAQTDKQGRLICWKCGKPINDTPHLDHWIPLKRGGTDNAGNLHYMHARCNTSKSSKLPEEIGRLL